MKHLRLTFAALLLCLFSVSNTFAQECANDVLVVIATESWGSEITWNITKSDSIPVASGGPYEDLSATTISICLEDGCYSFNMFDSFGDGWNGGLSSVIFGDDVVAVGTLETGSFGYYTFGINSDDCAASPIFGCTNPIAINFNPEATFDDGSCRLPCICEDEYAPVCVFDQELGEYITFNNLCEAECEGFFWITNEGTCEDPIICGCTDEDAENYDPNATNDNGTCYYPFECDGVPVELYICTFSNGDQVRLDILDSDSTIVYQSGQLSSLITYVDLCLDENECYTAIMYNSEGLPGWYNGYFWINANGVQITNESLNDDLSVETSQFSIDGSCGTTSGCTDQEAANYNPNATDDDGSCYYPCTCTDDWNPVCGYNVEVDDWMTYSNACQAECDGVFNYNEGECNFFSGCTNPIANNFDPNATFDDGSCVISACLDTFVPYTICYDDNTVTSLTFESDQDTGVTLNILTGVVESNFDIFTVYNGTQNDGDILFSGDGDLSGMSFTADSGTLTFAITSDGSISCGSGVQAPLLFTVNCSGDVQVGGCMDEEAINYDESATYDDGSCDYDNECTDTSAFISLTPGAFPNEISWFISDDNGNVVAGGEGYENDQTYFIDLCLQDGCYTLNALDSFGDGWNNAILLIEVNGFTYSFTLEVGAEGIYDFGVNTFECFTEIQGCMDEIALNYNPIATIEDGSCEYGFICEEGIVAQLYICTFSNGQNVDLSFLDNNGNEFAAFTNLNSGQIMNTDICLPEGCITAVMTNLAGENGWYNGYFWIQVNGETIVNEFLNQDAVSETAVFSVSGTDCPIAGCTDDTALNYSPNATTDDGSCEYYVPCEANEIIAFTLGGTFSSEVYWTISDEFGNVVAEMEDLEMASLICLEDGCYTVNMYDSFGDGWNGAELIITNGDTTLVFSFDYGDYSAAVLSINSECDEFEIYGCTDPEATNYNVEATSDDDSCEYLNELLGCTDASAINYNPVATLDNGSCDYEVIACVSLNQVTIYISTAQWGSEISWDLNDSEGNSVASGGDYSSYSSYSTVNCLADGCYELQLTDSWADGWSGAYYMIYDDGGLYAEGTLFYGGSGLEIVSINGDCEVAGCLDPEAVNYSPIATVDDGNCVYDNPFIGLDPEDLFGLELLVNVGPNPFENEFVINVTGLKDELPVNMKVINMMGQLVTEYQETPSNERLIKDLNGSAWASGTYFLKITQGDQQVSKKLVKQQISDFEFQRASSRVGPFFILSNTSIQEVSATWFRNTIGNHHILN